MRKKIHGKLLKYARVFRSLEEEKIEKRKKISEEEEPDDRLMWTVDEQKHYLSLK